MTLFLYLQNQATKTFLPFLSWFYHVDFYYIPFSIFLTGFDLSY